MNRTTKRVGRMIVALLVLTGIRAFGQAGPGAGRSGANVGQQQPAWKIDLRAFGYKHQPSTDPHLWNTTRVRFWHEYVVVESVTQVYDHALEEWLNNPPTGVWVFDVTNKNLVPKDVIANAEFPPMPDYPRRWHARGYGWATGVIAQWQKMAVTRDDHGALYLQEPGREPALLAAGIATLSTPGSDCARRAFFLAPDRIGVLPCTRKAIVVDKKGAKQYEVQGDMLDEFLTVSRDGTRFAAFRYFLSARYFLPPWKWPLAVSAILSDEVTIESDSAKVRVFSAGDGKKVFEYKWTVAKNDGYNGSPVALSDDGSMLALVENSELVVFQIPAGSK